MLFMYDQIVYFRLLILISILPGLLSFLNSIMNKKFICDIDYCRSISL